MGYVFWTFINYILNYKWTFKSFESHRYSITKFFAVAAFGLFINIIIMKIMINIFEIQYLISQLLAIGVIFVINFFVHKNWTFYNNQIH